MNRCVFCAPLALVLAAGCHDRSLEPCDIAESACQEGIYYVDLRVRGDGYDPFAGMPPIRTITEAQYRQELEAEAATQSGDSPQPWWDVTLSLLKLIPTQDTQSSSIDDSVINTAAFYSQNTRDVTVVEHPDQTADLEGVTQNMGTLAHELIHALQDRELDLRQSPAGTDATFANFALIEGDASLYERLFTYEIALPNGLRYKDQGNPVAYFSLWRDLFFAEEYATMGAPFFAARWMIYPLGGLWQASIWAKGGNAAVRHGYAGAPTRMLDFMAGPEVSPSAEVPIYCEPAIPNQFKNQGQAFGLDRIGATELFAYLAAWGVPIDVAQNLALTWRNDFLFVYYNQATQKTAAAWRIELSAPLPAEVLDVLKTSDQVHVLQSGTTLLVSLSDDATFLSSWSPTTACQ